MGAEDQVKVAAHLPSGFPIPPGQTGRSGWTPQASRTASGGALPYLAVPPDGPALPTWGFLKRSFRLAKKFFSSEVSGP